MKLFFSILAALAFASGFSSPAAATCLSGVCPTSNANTQAPIPPISRNWQSMITFNGGWAASTDGLASGIGDHVDVTSDITENYVMNSLGSVIVDPNCRADCGDQTLTSNWNMMQRVNNHSLVTSAGVGTTAVPIMARAGTMSMGSLAGFMGSQMVTGVPPLTINPLPEPTGN